LFLFFGGTDPAVFRCKSGKTTRFIPDLFLFRMIHVQLGGLSRLLGGYDSQPAPAGSRSEIEF